MNDLIRVALIDSSIMANSNEAVLETEILQGFGNVRQIHVAAETELPEWLWETDAIIIWHQVTLGRESIQKLKNCRIIIRNGVGFDNVDIAAAGAAGIPVCNVTDYGTEEVADHTLALTLTLARNIIPFDQQTKQLDWDWKIGKDVLRRLRGRVFGIIGLGRIGTAVALRAKAFGFQVIFYDPHLSPGVEKSLGIGRCWYLDELLQRSDLISLHCPLNPETSGMIGQNQFAKMKDDVILINTARGGIVELTDLKSALKSGKVRAAGFDVVDCEPPHDHEFMQLPNTLVTPHAAFYSQESFDECRCSSARLVRRYFEEGLLVNLVNSEYYQNPS